MDEKHTTSDFNSLKEVVIIYDWGWSQRENGWVTEKIGNCKVGYEKILDTKRSSILF